MDAPGAKARDKPKPSHLSAERDFLSNVINAARQMDREGE